MGLVQAPAGALPDFTKVVISLWFRAPAASCAAAGAKDYQEILGTTLPLLVFGMEGTINEQSQGAPTSVLTFNAHGYEGPVYWPDYGGDPDVKGWVRGNEFVTPVGYITATAQANSYSIYNTIYGPPVNTGVSFKSRPSLVGIDCTNTSELALRIEFSTGVYGSTQQKLLTSITPGVLYDIRENSFPLSDPNSDYYKNTPAALYIPVGWVMTPWDPANPSGPGDWLPPGAPPYPTIYDTGGLDDPRYVPSVENYTTETIPNAGTSSPGTTFYAGITPDKWHHVLISFDMGAKTIRTAVDDVSYPAQDLTESLTGLGDVVIPSAKYPVGIPATAAYTSDIYMVEMAELQIFTGVTLDPSDLVARRAFVDKDGKPVSPKYSIDPKTGQATADPESLPFLLLGKLPDIALCQSSGHWINGVNLGSNTAVFKKTGTVKSYTPEPQLGK